MFDKLFTDEVRLKIRGMDALLDKFGNMSLEETLTVKELRTTSHQVFDELIKEEFYVQKEKGEKAVHAFLGPDNDKYGDDCFTVFFGKKNELEWYLYKNSFWHGHTAMLSARWKNTEHIIIDDIDFKDQDYNVGHGTILMNYLFEYAKEHNAKYISGELSPEDKDHFDRSEAFYKKHGFTVSFEKDGKKGRIQKNL